MQPRRKVLVLVDHQVREPRVQHGLHERVLLDEVDRHAQAPSKSMWFCCCSSRSYAFAASRMYGPAPCPLLFGQAHLPVSADGRVHVSGAGACRKGRLIVCVIAARVTASWREGVAGPFGVPGSRGERPDDVRHGEGVDSADADGVTDRLTECADARSQSSRPRWSTSRTQGPGSGRACRLRATPPWWSAIAVFRRCPAARVPRRALVFVGFPLLRIGLDRLSPGAGQTTATPP